MEHQGLSELVVGLCINKKLSPDYVNSLSLYPPYDEAIKLLKDGADVTQLYDKIGFAPVQAANAAVQTANPDPTVDWIALLEKSYHRAELAKSFERQAKKLQRGEDPDLALIEAAIERSINLGNRYEILTNIKPEEGVWVKTGFQPFDYHMGGIPDSALTIIAGAPGFGKTSMAINIMHEMASLGKDVLFYTLEMTAEQIAWRIFSIVDEGKDKSYKDHIIINGDSDIDLSTIMTEAPRIAAGKNLGMVCIDFADLVTNKTDDESEVGFMYKSLEKLAKKIRTPVVLVSALNRQTYQGGIPRINHIRWSSMAEYSASLIVLLYNPNQTFTSYSGKDSDTLDAIPGTGWVIFGKSRFGYGIHKNVGAAAVGWDGKTSWKNEQGLWKDLSI